MKLGGQVLTAVQATPHASCLETTDKPPFYGIPTHAKPLLKQPTQVLKLKNVFNTDALSSLPESEVEEVLEDVRLECARFGTLKSVNIIKQSSPITSSEACMVTENAGSTGCSHDFRENDKNAKTETLEVCDDESGGISVESPRNHKEINEVVKDDDCINDDKPVDDLVAAKSSELGQLDTDMTVEKLAGENISKKCSPKLENRIRTPKDESDCHEDKVADINQTESGMETNLMIKGNLSDETDRKLHDSHAGLDGSGGTIEKGDDEESDHHSGLVFEPGCVFVEYGRTESSCMAAHCLHGRSFGDQIVAVEYVALDLYWARFPK